MVGTLTSGSQLFVSAVTAATLNFNFYNPEFISSNMTAVGMILMLHGRFNSVQMIRKFGARTRFVEKGYRLVS